MLIRDGSHTDRVTNKKRSRIRTADGSTILELALLTKPLSIKRCQQLHVLTTIGWSKKALRIGQDVD